MSIGKTNAIQLGGGATSVIREYTSSATWTKPTGLKYALVICIAGGGGGGSGRRGAAYTNRYGGCAGPGGFIVKRFLIESQLSSTESVIIGTGGNGGSAQTTDNSDGNNGSYGGDTSFGNLIVSKCSGIGLGGRTSSTQSGGQRTSLVNTPSGKIYTINPTTTSPSTNGTPSNYGFIGFSNADYGCMGGMVGAGISSSNVLGSMINSYSCYKVDGTLQSGVGSSTNGNDNIALQLLSDYISSVLSKGCGIGGGGGLSGDAAGTIAGGNGGNGGNYGAGGGGGGASTNGANSGAGGNGGNGLCIVLEIY